MTKARILANLISDNAELADGQISVAEVVGAAPTASPDFTGTVDINGTNGPLRITGSGYVLNPTALTLGRYTATRGFIQMPTDNGSGQFEIWDGATNQIALFTPTQFVWNEGGGDRDFRVESDNNANMFFVNGGTDRIGIGTSNPSTFIHAQSSGDIHFRFETTSDSTAQIQYKNGNNQWSAGIDNLEQFFIYDSTNAHSALTFIPLDEVVFNQNSKDVDFRVESDGNANMLFVDAANNEVGVGTSNPGSTLEVNGNFRPTYYYPHAPTSQTSSNNNNYWKLGNMYLPGPYGAEIVMHGAKPGYSSGGTNVGKLTILLRGGTNASLLDAVFYAEGDNSSVPCQSVRYVPNGSYEFEIYVQLGNYESTSHTVVTGGSWTEDVVNTGSTSAPNNSVGIPAQRATWLGPNEVMSQYTYGTTINETGNDHDFRVESDSNTHMLFVDASANRIGIGTSSLENTLQINGEAQFGLTSESYHSKLGANSLVFNRAADSFVDQRDGSGNLNFRLGTGYTSMLKLGSEAVFNDGGADRDFRVESDSNANMLFVDAGNNRIGIRNTGYNTTADLNLLGKGLSLKNDVNGNNNNWSLIQNDITSDQANIKFISGSGNMELTHGAGLVISPGQNGYPFVFNESSKDCDFRVETDNQAYAFFIDASTDTVEIRNQVFGTAPTVGGGHMVQFNTNQTTVNSNNSVTTNLFTRSPNAEVSATGTVYVAAENSGGSVQFGYIIDFFFSNGTLQTTARETGSSQGTVTCTVQENGAAISVTVAYTSGLGGAIRFNAGGIASLCSY